MKKTHYYILFGLFLLSLYPLSRYNFLLFHTFVEAWAMVVATSIFLVALNTKDFTQDSYLLFLGVGYLFVAILTFFHTITYYGLNIFPGIGPNPATQFWILGRYLETLILITTPFLVGMSMKKRLLNTLFIGMGLFTVLGSLSILVFPIFPTCFEEGVGLTPFKVYSEYGMILLLLSSVFYLYKKRREKRRWFYGEYTLALILTILSGLSFTLYQDVYGFFNFLGHIFYLISFYIIYRLIFQRGLKRPTRLLFHKLSETGENLKTVNRCLLSFDSDHRENMQRILKTLGDLFQADGVSFNEQIGDTLITRAHYKMESTPSSYPKEGSLCEEVLKRDPRDPLIYTNLEKNKIYREEDPRIKRYHYTSLCGCPVIIQERVQGTLVLFFKKERTLSKESLQTLSTFAQILGDELVHLQMAQSMERSLDRARSLQQSLYPKELPTIRGIIPATSFWQAQETGGDYFNLHYNGEKLFLFMVDVTGHGLDAALITVYVSSFFRREIKDRLTSISPETFLRRLHYDFIQQRFPDDYSLEAFAGLLNVVTMDFSYASAGSIRSMKLEKNREITPLPRSSGSIINNAIQDPILGTGQIYLRPREALLFYTDGLDEPFLFADVDRGRERMAHYSREYFQLLPFQEMVERLIEETHQELGSNKHHDDMAIMGIYHQENRREKRWTAPKHLTDITPFIHGIIEEISYMLRDPAPIQMALTEAVNNGVEHAEDEVTIEASWSKEEILFRVTDDGPGYNWRRVLEEKKDVLNLEEERGRGLSFISLAADRFALNREGNSITMSWSLLKEEL